MIIEFLFVLCWVPLSINASVLSLIVASLRTNWKENVIYSWFFKWNVFCHSDDIEVFFCFEKGSFLICINLFYMDSITMSGWNWSFSHGGFGLRGFSRNEGEIGGRLDNYVHDLWGFFGFKLAWEGRRIETLVAVSRKLQRDFCKPQRTSPSPWKHH